MIEIVVHGRGGQGAVTFAIMLAKAAGLEGKWVQAFPAFGVERRGAPVRAFCRIDKKPITQRTQVYKPDWAVVLDESLIESGVVKIDGAKVVINSKKDYPNCSSFDATAVALDILGKPIVNTAMLGFFAHVSKLVKLDSLLKSLEDIFSGKLLELNKRLVSEAYERAA
ncbi:MAG: 2-oxoacid:acceptor oxidoreductase family protein [Candidatus Aenigmatarchaeota archaeon]